LTYLSEATAPLDRQQLEGLLTVSRTWNASAGLTGMLLYAEGHFIQTLEGDHQDVEALMARIRADPRHHHIDVTLEEEIEERYFHGWAMGFRQPSPEEVRDLEGFTDYLDPAGKDYRAERLGHAGAFHRAFRDTLPPEPL